MNNKAITTNNIRLWLTSLLILICMWVPGIDAFGVNPDHYRGSSRMAEGKWVKISVKETGMQFVSNTFIRNQGFSDPSKVNVYGYGGHVISEALNDSHPDDLVPAPAIRTTTGILFFGRDNIRWTRFNAGLFTHEMNPYSPSSYYFLSDCEPDEKIFTEAEEFTGQPAGGTSSFQQLLLYETNIAAPSNTGRILLGEDFRTQNTRSFQFNLPGNIGNVVANIKFGAAVTNGSSSLSFSANGTDLESAATDQIAAITNNKQFVRYTTTQKKLNIGTSDKLNLQIKYTGTGAISLARLDWIEVSYIRELALHNGELVFSLSSTTPTKYTLANATSETLLWDVTDVKNPIQIPINSDGSFVLTGTGIRELVAFNPSGSFRTPTSAGKVSNQNLHGMPVPDMVIISPKEYVSAAERLAQFHRDDDDMIVYVITPEQFYNEFSSGTPDIGAFRKGLKMWYDRGMAGVDQNTLKHCLIYSKPTYDNMMVTEAVKRAGYPRVPIWQSSAGTSESTSYSTDSFVAMLEDSTDEQFNIATAKLSIGVGRLPVKSVQEANDATDKIINYARNSIKGSWRKEVMIIADDQDNNQHFKQAQSAYNLMRTNGGETLLYNRLYLDAYPLESGANGQVYTIPNKKLKQAFDDGVLYMVYIGHADPREWGHEALMTWTDIKTKTNRKLPFIYAATCEFVKWDDDAVSGGEELWLYPVSGTIGMFSASRSVYIAQNGILTNSMSKVAFQPAADGKGKRLGDIFKESLNGLNNDDNKLRYLLMADPALRLPVPFMNVEVTEIAGTDITSIGSDDYPEIPAKGKVALKGVVNDPEGNIAADFNGTIEISLYDAEKVIETLGNGEDGKSEMYNDRQTRLLVSRAEVKNGEWSTTMYLPSEIENNHSPALISLYAYDAKGREGMGSTEKLYVVGYNEEADDDKEGPEISNYYLNAPTFQNNDLVAESVVVYATVSDPSGINISDFGIGHNLSMLLDGKTHYTDVSSYYTPDNSDPCKGSITYHITGIEPGEHTLAFTAWDNANNSNTRELQFRVMAGSRPNLVDINTDVNPASTSVTFLLSHDRPGQALNATIEVFDLGGKKVWQSNGASVSGALDSDIRMSWNLTDGSGSRVPRGIYLYRATIETAEGRTATKTKKLAVTAK